MTLRLLDVSWLSVVVAGLAGMMIGGLWYGPLFGEAWVRRVGFRKEDIQTSEVNVAMTVALGTTLVKAYLVALLLQAAGAKGALAGLVVGSLAGAIIALSVWMNQMFERRSGGFIAISVSNHLVVLAAMGAILGAWR